MTEKDNYKPDKQQQLEWVQQALTKDGFNESTQKSQYYHKVIDENVKVIVNLNDGKKEIFFSAFDTIREDDDDAGTLAAVATLIAEAMTGAMPTKSEPDIVVNKHITSVNGIPAETNAMVSTEGTASPNAPAGQESPQALTPFTPAGNMIKGLRPQLKEIGKIKIGRKGQKKQGAKGEYRLPEKFNHFEVVTLQKDEKTGDFIPDAAIMQAIGTDAKEIDVALLYNDPTLNFMTRYNEYKGGKCMCSGDGEQATKEDGTKLVCDLDTCSKFKAKKCKANGILSVVLPAAPRLGGVYKFRTTSFNSIRSILSSMFFIQSLTGGVLANIPLKLTVSPQTVNPVGSPTAQTIYVVNLEYPGTVEDLHKKTVALMTERASMQHKIAELETQAKAALNIPESKEEIQDVEAEFYPDNLKEVGA